MLGLLVRPYFLYNPRSSWFPGRLTAGRVEQPRRADVEYASRFSQRRPKRADPWSIYDSENHDAQAESFYFLAAQIFKNTPGVQHEEVRRPHDRRAAVQGVARPLEQVPRRARQARHCSSRSARRRITATRSARSSTSTTSPTTRCCGSKAGMLLDLDFADYAQQQLQRHLGGAKSRSYPGRLVRRQQRQHHEPRQPAVRPGIEHRGRQPRAHARDERLQPAAGRANRWDRITRASGASRTSRGGPETARSAPTRTTTGTSNTEPERPRLRVRHARLRSWAPPS